MMYLELAVVIAFKQKFDENSVEEKERDYSEYKALGGTLNQEEYGDVLRRAVDGKNVPPNPMWSAHANFMVQAVGITLSPETVTIYEILRKVYFV
ncbi:MAG: hypothetical protein AAB428_00335 [Patescibacteria group bacterium]